jgi:hypothetical protein
MTNSTDDRQCTFQPKITHGMPDFKEAQQKIQM